MMRSVAAVESLIEKEVKERGIKEERIVIGGFSQGCVISILTALRTQRKVAGVISLSGWLPLSHKIEEVRFAPVWNALDVC
jgi:predicted esterase